MFEENLESLKSNVEAIFDVNGKQQILLIKFLNAKFAPNIM